MKICFLCDLHLPRIMSALQYDALDWALADASCKQADCIAVAGDITCDGNSAVYDFFKRRIRNLGMPVLYIPGNSDLRDPNTADTLRCEASSCMTAIGDVTLFALNDCDREVASSDFDLLEMADENSVVFLHHPIRSHGEETRKRLQEFCDTHPKTMIFYGHRHISLFEGNTVSLLPLDPDKAIGECPAITYYDTDTRQLEKAYYFASVPTDLFDHLGISCYKVRQQIEFAIDNRLRCLELRNNLLKEDAQQLKALIERWRQAGGENLCVHLPDVGFEDGTPVLSDEYLRLVHLADSLGADRVTQHVPLISVNTVAKYPQSLGQIAESIAQVLRGIDRPFTVGIENMHMTASDDVNVDRRFGYTPEECLHFMRLVAEKTKHRVGINFDIGHARNNAPFSRTYQIGSWLAMLGKDIVGYHFHQVKKGQNGFENHMPIAELHGGIINFTTFFKSWMRDEISHVPVILEMRPENAYPVSLQVLRRHAARVSDLHTHTYYSWCGKDRPQDIVEMAIQNGLSSVGITDHAHGVGDRIVEYAHQIRMLARKNQDRIRVLCGIEIATLPHRFDEHITEKLGELDFCLIEHITDPASRIGKDLLDFCKRAGIPCGIAHTDLFAYCDMYGYEPLEYFSALANAGVFWEINVNYDSVHHYRRHAYVSDLMNDPEKLEIVRKSGLLLSVGSDCHRAGEYNAKAVYDAYAFLREYGLKTVM